MDETEAVAYSGEADDTGAEELVNSCSSVNISIELSFVSVVITTELNLASQGFIFAKARKNPGYCWSRD